MGGCAGATGSATKYVDKQGELTIPVKDVQKFKEQLEQAKKKVKDLEAEVSKKNRIIKQLQKDLQKDEILPFFKGFMICKCQLQVKGDYTFPNNFLAAETQVRGGFPYYQPVLGQRYGIKVMGLYDNNDDWIRMDKVRNEWAIAFHGVRNPQKLLGKLTTFKCIMQGRLKGEMLIAGDNQYYADKMCVNYPTQKVGKGVYLSPHCEVSLIDYSTPVTINGETYHIVLQCRVKPEKVRICSGMEDYWVVNQSKYMRPYGIILFTPNQKSKIETHLNYSSNAFNRIHKRFLWSEHAQNYQTFINKT